MNSLVNYYIKEEYGPASVGGMPNVGAVTIDNSLPSNLKDKDGDSIIAKCIPAATIAISDEEHLESKRNN